MQEVCPNEKIALFHRFIYFLFLTIKEIARLNVSTANLPRSSASYMEHAEEYSLIASLTSVVSMVLDSVIVLFGDGRDAKRPDKKYVSY